MQARYITAAALIAAGRSPADVKPATVRFRIGPSSRTNTSRFLEGVFLANRLAAVVSSQTIQALSPESGKEKFWQPECFLSHALPLSYKSRIDGAIQPVRGIALHFLQAGAMM